MRVKAGDEYWRAGVGSKVKFRQYLLEGMAGAGAGPEG